jgi:hypothetical protein
MKKPPDESGGKKKSGCTERKGNAIGRKKEGSRRSEHTDKE